MIRRSLAFVAVVAVTLASLLLAPTGPRSPLAAASPFASPAASPAFSPAASPAIPPAVTSPTPDLLATVQAELTATAAAAAFAPQRTATALATQNAQLQGALAALATSDAGKGHALAAAQATIAALTTQVAALKATINAVPTATPTPVPTNIPVPTPTPLPKAGTVLYQADVANGGFSKWSGSADWKHVNGMLVNDGTNGRASEILAPFQPSVGDYAVEAEIQMVGGGTWCMSFGVFARGDEGTGYSAGIGTDSSNCQGLARIAPGSGLGPTNQSPILASQAFDPGTDWHTYRLEVQGNTIRLLIDGAVTVEAVDNRYLSPGDVGLWTDGTQINVRSFKVISLGSGATGSGSQTAAPAASTANGAGGAKGAPLGTTTP